MGGKWSYVSLDTLAAEEKGAISIGPFGSRMKADVYVPNGVPVIRGANITGSRWLKDDWVYVTEEFSEGIRNCVVKPGDLVFPHRGAIGEVALIEPQHGRMVLSTSMMKFRPDPEKANSKFLYYYFRSRQGRQEILRFGSQVGTPGIGQPLSSMRQFQVPNPPIETQNAIGEVLGAFDDKIELNRQMNRTLEAMARAIFKAWFVDFEPVKAKAAGATSFRGMPQDVFDHLPAQLTESELGPVPEGWDVIPLSSLIELIGGGTPKRKSPEYWGGGIPWFSVRDAPYESDVWVIGTQEKITQMGVDNSSAKVMPEGTTIVSARGTVGRLALTAVPMAINQSCYGVRGQDSIGDFFVYFTLRDAVADLQQRTHGSVFDTITRKTFEGLTRVRPDKNSLKAFEEVVAPFVFRIRSNLFENQILASIRDALLPKLISGEIRVPEALEGADGG